MLKRLAKNAGHPRGLTGKILLSGMNIGHGPLHKWGIELAGPDENASVLDIGCGGGALIALILERCPRGKACGIDLSATSLECSRAKNASQIAAGKCEIREGSAEAIPYPDNSFDLATAFETLYFWKDLDKAFSEILRVLKTGGTFLAANNASDPSDTTWTSIVYGMTVYGEEELGRQLEAAGFAKIAACRGENGSICLKAKKG